MRKLIIGIILLAILFKVVSAQEVTQPKIPIPFILKDGPVLELSFQDKPEDEGAAKTGDWDTSFKTVLFDGTSFKQMQNGAFSPGNGNAVADLQWKGTMLIVCHSGTHHQVPLQCENFRRALEGKLWDKITYTPDATTTTNIYAQIMANAANIIGDSVQIKQGGNPDVRFDIAAVAYLPNGKAVDDYIENDKVIFSNATQHDITGTTGAWKEAADSPQQYLLLAFCGWGPYTSSTLNEWYSWSRYVLLLRPIDLISSDDHKNIDGVTAMPSPHHTLHPHPISYSILRIISVRLYY